MNMVRNFRTFMEFVTKMFWLFFFTVNLDNKKQDLLGTWYVSIAPLVMSA